MFVVLIDGVSVGPVVVPDPPVVVTVESYVVAAVVVDIDFDVVVGSGLGPVVDPIAVVDNVVVVAPVVVVIPVVVGDGPVVDVVVVFVGPKPEGRWQKRETEVSRAVSFIQM